MSGHQMTPQETKFPVHGNPKISIVWKKFNQNIMSKGKRSVFFWNSKYFSFAKEKDLAGTINNFWTTIHARTCRTHY